MEGRPELDIALKLGLEPKTILFCESYIKEPELDRLIDLKSAEVIRLSKSLFDDLSYQNVPGNFMLEFDVWKTSLADLKPQWPLVVIESIEKPGNLGAILRTCDGAGIKNVLVTNSQIDLFNPNVIRNSRGAVFTVNTVFCSNEEALRYIKTQNLSTYAAALTDDSRDYQEVNKDEDMALVFGPESTGLSQFWMTNSQNRIMIPMRGTVDSLNVSVSAAIMLYEATKV